MRKRVIPRPEAGRMFNEAVKENLEVIMGFRGEKIKPLPGTASAAEVIAKVNEILRTLQA